MQLLISFSHFPADTFFLVLSTKFRYFFLISGTYHYLLTLFLKLFCTPCLLSHFIYGNPFQFPFPMAVSPYNALCMHVFLICLPCIFSVWPIFYTKTS
uniref:Uncharacterized protein n=1 Tax=Oryza brachyantha TaxID=4533 RepID=J3KXA8_ORYBR